MIVPGPDAASLVGQLGGTLRAVLGVVSPEFVRTSRLDPRNGRPRPAGHFVKAVRDRQALMAMTARAVASYTGADSVEVDADGDFPVEKDGGTYLWVRVDEHLPVVRVWAVMVVGVRKKSQALTEVNLLNRRVAGVAFTLVENRVHVTADLTMTPFASEMLHNCLARMADVIAANASDFSERCGGIPCPA